ncbi:MAG: hypothetical protein WBV77_07090 [Solirubrobacteraceae bacterium]
MSVRDDTMRYFGDPELTCTPCPACGCVDVFTALAPPGERERPTMLRCCWCHRERADLEFHEEAA